MPPRKISWAIYSRIMMVDNLYQCLLPYSSNTVAPSTFIVNIIDEEKDMGLRVESDAAK